MAKPAPSLLILCRSKGFGGLELNTLKLLKAFQQGGIDVHFAWRKGSRLAQEQIAHAQGIFLSGMDLRDAVKLQAYLKRNKIHKVFSPFRPDIALVYLLKSWMRKPIEFTYQQQMQHGRHHKRRLIHKWRYGCIDNWVAPLPWLKAQTLVKTTVPEEIIHVVPLGVDTSRFPEAPLSKVEAHSQLKLQLKGTVIGVLGRIERNKGQVFLLDCVERLRSDGHEVSLLIWGQATVNSPNAQAYYAKLANRLQANTGKDIVAHIDFSRDVSLFFSAIDIFSMSSRSETFGMVTVEAMLNRVPIIGTNAGGTPELLDEGRCGHLYPFEDADAFCSGVIDITSSAEETQAMTENAYERAIEYYTLEREVEGLLRVMGLTQAIGSGASK